MPEALAAIALAPHGLAEGLRDLARRDPDLHGIVESAGSPRFPLREPGFGTLLHIILGQQVSIDAAAAMYRRLQRCCTPLTPARFLDLADPVLRECGFSRQKMLYARNLASRILDGSCALDALATMPDEAAAAELMLLKGIGRWSAEIYLLFALGRADIWPAQDLGLQLAAQRLKRLPERPGPQQLLEIGEAWRPWRSVAACLLWQFYLTSLGRRDAAVV